MPARLIIAACLSALLAIPAHANSLAAAPELERQALTSFLAGEWPQRAIAAQRLERFDDDASAAMLIELLDDPSWRVRCFAIRALAVRGIPQQETWFADEQHPRVVRAILRHGYSIPPDRLARGIDALSRADTFDERLLAVELAMASADTTLHERATEDCRTIILRMGRVAAGRLTPRLQRLTNHHTSLSHHDWHIFLRKQGRAFTLRRSLDFPPDHSPTDLPRSAIAQMPTDSFADLETYMADLRGRSLDLAIVLDCTLSMEKEIADAQTGIDGLMAFLSAFVSDLRIGIVAYRDRRSRDFETYHWDFTRSADQARNNIFKLTTASGGDWPEAVLPALRTALNDLSWNLRPSEDGTPSPTHRMIMVLIGDAPPHPGYGSQCVALVKNAHTSGGLICHTIEADGKPVKHFAEIATSGGGRCVPLADDASLTAEIAGLTLTGRHERPMRAFFETYLRLCR